MMDAATAARRDADAAPLLTGRKPLPPPPPEAFESARRSAEPSQSSSSSRPPPQREDQYRRHRVGCIGVLVVCAAALISRYDAAAVFLSAHGEDVEVRGGGGGRGRGRDGDGDGDGDGPSRSRSPWGTAAASSPPTASELLARIADARAAFDDLLRSDYGEYADAALSGPAVRRAFRSPTGASAKRLKRRMKIKVIEAALGGSGSVSGSVSGGEGGFGATTFRWVTAGHSAAAGHGNLFNQTYTASVQDAASVVFGAAGIEFIAMNYAAGGTSSGPEHSLCMEAIYGRDIDVLWWDFGMTDGNDFWKYQLWGCRAASHPTLPVLLHYGTDFERARIRERLERSGLATFALTDVQRLRLMFPDSKDNPRARDMPRAVAYYMCGHHHENDDVCNEHKWDTERFCPGNFGFQVSWHNGWKDHLFIGRIAAVLLVELLAEAVRELDPSLSSLTAPLNDTARLRSPADGGAGRDAVADADADADAGARPPPAPSISSEYLSHLRSLDESDRAAFIESGISSPNLYRGKKFRDVGDETWGALLDPSRRPYCRPADLPAQARFDGLVPGGTGDGREGGARKAEHAGYGRHVGYEVGHSIKALPPPGATNGTGGGPILAWFEGNNQHDFHCEGVTRNINFKDAFLVRHEDGWVSDVLPREEELEAYFGGDGAGQGERELRGIFVICTRWCDWGKCQYGHVGLEEVGTVARGNVSIAVDGREATGVQRLDERCSVLVGPDGGVRFGPPRRRGVGGGGGTSRLGRYEVKFRVNKPGGNLLMSAIIIL